MSEDCPSQKALERRSKVAQTTIGNYLHQDYKGYPNLEKVERLAHAFGLEAWNLLHPTMGEKTISEQEVQMFLRLKTDLNQLQEPPKPLKLPVK